MTSLKFICVSSCIGGLIPLVASTEFLPFVAEQLMPSYDTETPDSEHESVEATNHDVLERTALMNGIAEQMQHTSAAQISAFGQAGYPTHLSFLSMNFLEHHRDDRLPSTLPFGGVLDLKASVEFYGDQLIRWSRYMVRQVASEATQNVSIRVVPTSAAEMGASVQNVLFNLDTDTSQDLRSATQYDQVDLEYCNITTPTSETVEIAERTLFQVQVDNTPVAEFTRQNPANRFAVQVKALIEQRGFQPEHVTPSPSGAVEGNRFVITSTEPEAQVAIPVDAADLQRVGYRDDFVAIAWANNLRIALGAVPLSLGEAQARLQSLEKNGELLYGIASWYGPYFHGRITASGEPFNQNELTAAHPSLPFDTYLKVTNLVNGRTVVVRINDRGPYIGRRSLDLSRQAARCLDSETDGVVPYRAVVLEPGAVVRQELAQVPNQ